MKRKLVITHNNSKILKLNFQKLKGRTKISNYKFKVKKTSLKILYKLNYKNKNLKKNN